MSKLPRSIRNLVDPPLPSHPSLLHFIHEVSKKEKKNRSQERSVTLINSSLHPSHPGKYFYRKRKIFSKVKTIFFSLEQKKETSIHNFKIASHTRIRHCEDMKTGDERFGSRSIGISDKQNNTVYQLDRYLACKKTGMFDAWQRWMAVGGSLLTGRTTKRGAVGPFAAPLFHHSVPCPRNWAARANSVVELARLRCVQPSKGFAFVRNRGIPWRFVVAVHFSPIFSHPVSYRGYMERSRSFRINRWNTRREYIISSTNTCISFYSEIDILSIYRET